MLSKKELKDIQSLCHKKHRDEQKMFIAEGPKLAGELLNSDFKIEKIYATEQWIRSNGGQQSIEEVTEDQLKRISNLQRPNEVLIVARQKMLEEEPLFRGNVTIVLDGLQDPGNMGTIIRIADWFGIKQIVASNDTVELYNPKVVQSTMGSICRVDVWYRDMQDLFADTTVPVFGALLQGRNIYSMQKIEEGILIIGNESKGIREPLLSAITHPVTIPKKGGAESLNAAIAAGIIIGCMVNG